MTTYLLYCGLLALWLPLLWPAIRLSGGARLWLWVVVAVGIAALAHEIRMVLFSFAAIRLDILVISVALTVLYGSAAVLLLVKNWRLTGAIFAVVLVSISGGIGDMWADTGRQSQHLNEVFQESNRLLFQAKFRDRETYENYFRPFDGFAGGRPTGHWRSVERSHFTRLVVNAEGRVWLFYQCQVDAECHFGPEGSGLRQSADNPERWVASLTPRVGQPLDIAILRTSPGTLTVDARQQSHLFAEAPPPVDTAMAPNSLVFHGPFATLECSAAHATIRQIWLWQDGARLFAVGLFATLIAGQQNDFVSPVVMREGIREDGGWHFTWQQESLSGTALVKLTEGGAILTLDLAERDLEDADRTVMTRGGVFGDERVELAPLTNGADWSHWFDHVLVGHFLSGYVPAC